MKTYFGLAIYAALKGYKEEGIFAGGSSGAVVWAAIEIGKKLPDKGYSYISKIFNDEWMREKGFNLVFT